MKKLFAEIIFAATAGTLACSPAFASHEDFAEALAGNAALRADAPPSLRSGFAAVAKFSRSLGNAVFDCDLDYFLEAPSALNDAVADAALFRFSPRPPSVPAGTPPALAAEKFAELRLAEAEKAATGFPAYFSASARILEPVGDFASVAVVAHEFVGGAHGVTVCPCLSFDLAAGTRIALADVFKKDFERPLETLLAAHDSREGRRPDGVFPDPFATENFLICADGLRFVYSPYEIDCYAAGVIVIFVPYAELSALLRDDFRERLEHGSRPRRGE